MRLSPFALTVVLIAAPLTCQTVTGSTPDGASSSPLEAQTIDPKVLLVEALQAGGGQAKLAAVKDFLAHGSITLGADTAVGETTIRAHGKDQFRMDSIIGGKTLSWSINHGNGNYKTSEPNRNRSIASYDAVNAGWLTLPNSRLMIALDSPNVEVKYIGLQLIDGKPSHQIRVVRHLPKDQDPQGLLSELGIADYYLSSENLRVLRIVDEIHPGRAAVGLNSRGQVLIRKITRTLNYSDFRSVEGIVMPFLIDEDVAQQRMWTVQLSDIGLNTGLSDHDFDLQ